MNKSRRLMALMVLGLFLSVSTVIAAEEIHGYVLDVKPEKHEVTVRPKTGAEEDKIEFKATEKSQFQGLGSLQDVGIGDEIHISADKKLMSPWEILTLSKNAATETMGTVTASQGRMDTK